MTESITGFVPAEEEPETTQPLNDGTVEVETDDVQGEDPGFSISPDMPKALPPSQCSACGYETGEGGKGWVTLQSTPPVFYVFICPECGTFRGPRNVWELTMEFEKASR